MKSITTIFCACLFLLSGPTTAQEDQHDAFLGRWALHLPEGAGWLDVRQEKGYLDADILWIGGSVVPVDHIHIDGAKLMISRISSRTHERENNRKHQITTFLIAEVAGDRLVGKYVEPHWDGNGAQKTVFWGTKIPDLPPAPNYESIKYGDPIELLSQRDLDGWSLLRTDRENGWSVKDGVLSNNPVQKEGEAHIRYGNLRTEATFEDFNLKLKVNVPEGNNSGIYLRGIYEVQVFDSFGKDLDSHHMGAVYSRLTPNVNAEKKGGEWQDFDITLCDRHATVILNGTKIIDNQPLMGVTGGAITADEFSPGPIYLQGDHGNVKYKDIILTPIIK